MTFRNKVNFLFPADKGFMAAGHSPHSDFQPVAGTIICHRTKKLEYTIKLNNNVTHVCFPLEFYL